MKGDYEPDQFTEADVLRELDNAGLKHRNGHRYILSQCPTHEDTNPSVQIYKDDWFVNCHAGCGRFHITKAFPSLREIKGFGGAAGVYSSGPKKVYGAKKVTEHKYKTFDQMKEWERMSPIPEDHVFKGIPIETLNDLGWRYDDQNHRYFIPYWDMSRTHIPFSQWRNLSSGPRFNFLKDAKPIVYGLWNLDNPKLFVVEGSSDGAVLDYCGVPWIAMPSAASGELMKRMAGYCKEKGIELIYAGDRDEAGDKLRQALDEVMPYRVKQPRQPYKDWGDMFEAEGMESVQNYCFQELFPQQYPRTVEEAQAAIEAKNAVPVTQGHIDNVLKEFPGAKVLEIVDPSKEVRSNQLEPTNVLF